MPDPYHWIRRAKHGSAFLVPAPADGSLKGMTWLIRKSSAEIEPMKTRPVELFTRGGVFESNNALVLVTLVAFGRSPESDQDISEAFLDEYGKPFGGAVETLANQARMPVYFFGDSGGLEHTQTFENLARPFVAPALVRISKLSPWTSDQFDAALIDLFNQCPTPKRLWDRLSSGETPKPQ